MRIYIFRLSDDDMIDNFFLVAEQSLIIFLVIGIGYILGKTGIMSEESENCCAALYMYLTSPAITIYSFQRPFDHLLLNGFLLALGLSAAGIFLCIIVARITLHGNTKAETNVLCSSVIFTSCGMIAFALQNALYGAEGIFYGVAYCCVNSITT